MTFEQFIEQAIDEHLRAESVRREAKLADYLAKTGLTVDDVELVVEQVTGESWVRRRS